MEWNDTMTGVLMGGGLTAAGFVYKRHLDNQSVLKKSLYQLLILHRSVVFSSSSDHSEMARWAIEVINEVIPGASESEGMHGAHELYSGLVSKLLESVRRPEDENLVPMYLDAVESISSIDPILAYRLNGNAALKRYLVSADAETRLVREQAAKELSADDMKIVENAHQDAAVQVSKEVIRELRSDLLLLSFKCGLWQFIRVVYRLYKRPESKESEEARIKASIRSVLEKFIRPQQHET